MFALMGQGCSRHPAETRKFRLKFEVARQARSSSLCVPVRAEPWADEAEQQLSRLAPSVWQLSGDVHTFGAGLWQEHSRDPLGYV